MKNILFLIILTTICNVSFSQKKKTSKKSITNNTASLAKVDNLTIEFSNKNFYVSIDKKSPKKDTLSIKNYRDKTTPIDYKIQSFTTKGTKLYLLTWTEKTKTESRLINEDITTIFSLVFDPITKTKNFSNKQSTTLIKQIRFLDKKETVSETIDKKRSEGFTVSLLTDGDILLKGKSQEYKMSYNTTDKKYEAKVKR